MKLIMLHGTDLEISLSCELVVSSFFSILNGYLNKLTKKLYNNSTTWQIKNFIFILSIPNRIIILNFENC